MAGTRYSGRQPKGNLSIEKVAKILGMNRGAVRRAEERAIDKFAKLLIDEDILRLLNESQRRRV